MTPEQIGQALIQAGWRLDGGFSEYLIVGHDNAHASIIAHKLGVGEGHTRLRTERRTNAAHLLGACHTHALASQAAARRARRFARRKEAGHALQVETVRLRFLGF